MKLARITKREIAYKRLRYGILNGDFSPGEKLVEKDLSMLFNIGTTPIREAIRQLQSEGLIAVYPNRGAAVRKVPQEQVLDALEVSAVLEAYAVELSAKTIRSKDTKRLRTLAQEIENAIDMGDTKKYISKEEVFHDMFPKIMNNTILIQNIKTLRIKYLKYLGILINIKDYSGRVINYHNDILEAIHRGDSKTAGSLMRQHILDMRTDIADIIGLF